MRDVSAAQKKSKMSIGGKFGGKPVGVILLFDNQRSAIMAPKKRSEYSTTQRVKILTLKAKSMSNRGVAKKMKISRRGVDDFVKRTKERNSIEDLPRSGHPKAIPEKILKEVLLSVKRSLSRNLEEMQEWLKANSTVTVSKRTIHNAVVAKGFRAYRLVKKPLLSGTKKEASKNLSSIVEIGPHLLEDGSLNRRNDNRSRWFWWNALRVPSKRVPI